MRGGRGACRVVGRNLLGWCCGGRSFACSSGSGWGGWGFGRGFCRLRCGCILCIGWWWCGRRRIGLWLGDTSCLLSWVVGKLVVPEETFRDSFFDVFLLVGKLDKEGNAIERFF